MFAKYKNLHMALRCVMRNDFYTHRRRLRELKKEEEGNWSACMLEKKIQHPK